jgi:extracellular elastinolytic metalloproteinase
MKKILLALLVILNQVLNAQITPSTSQFADIILAHSTTLKPDDLKEMKLSSMNIDKQSGVSHYYFNQYYKNIPVHNGVIGLHLDAQGQWIASNSTFISNPQSVYKTETSFNNPIEAINIAMQVQSNTKIIGTSENNFVLISKNENEYIYTNSQISHQQLKAHLVWLKRNNDLTLCWNINWLSLDEQNWWNVRIGTNENAILDKNNWINHCEASTLHNHDREGLQIQPENQGQGEGSGEGKTSAKYRVLALPVESPSHGNMSLLNDPSDSLASPFSWHDDNGITGHEYTITRGNNVYASEDKNNDNVAGYSPNGGSTLNFDFTFDKTKRHTDYLDAAITNLFYWNNQMHDVWYHYGFDDASGNFQANNYSRGGAGSDEVMAEAQDGSGTNNANFGTPPDGQNPRMQMFVWNVSSTSFLLRVTSPTSISRAYTSVLAGFGPKLTTTPIIGDIILVNDGSTNPSQSCQDLINASSINGQIALVDRGSCTFLEKVQFAQNAGAKAVIVVNSSTGNIITMGGTGGAGITIPSIMISKADGDLIKNTLKGGQSVKGSLYDSIGAAGKQYDSDFDNGIICHEYGHGISNRLTGGAANTSCLTNEEQMGEGWSDFFGLVMTHEPGDKGIDRRGIGTYAIDEPNTGDGIRNYPYSTSLSINPVTYKDIKSFSVPHGVGSVWCSMLWDMYWDFIAKYGYDPNIYTGKGGNNLAMKLVIEGMKMQPCNPGFTDGRDAILLADRTLNKGANQELIWKSFARRGLGKNADQGSSDDRGDGTENFEVPKFDLPEIKKTAVSVIPSGGELIYKIVLTNSNLFTLKQITLRDTIKNGLLFLKAEGFSKGNFSSPVYTAIIDSLRSGDSLVGFVHTRVASPTFTSFVETSDFEGAINDWKDSLLIGSGKWNLSTAKKNSGNNSLFCSNASTQTDRTIMKTFAQVDIGSHLMFYHLYNTETDWDGGVIEVLKNGIWTDLGPYMIENGYNKTISTNPNSSISNRKAFSGKTNSFIRTIIDLSNFTGSNVKLRFRFGSDAAQGGEGWYIDDISLVNNLTIVSNKAFISNAQGSSAFGMASTLVLKAEQIGIKQPKASQFTVTPNPFKDELKIWSDKKTYSVTIMDVLGKVVILKTDLNDVQTIETGALKSGTYFIRIETAEGNEVLKIVK